MTAPSYLSGSFDLGDWHIDRYEPANDNEPREVHIVATNDTHTDKRIVIVPLFHPNHFGLDIDDVTAIDVAVEELLADLGLT